MQHICKQIRAVIPKFPNCKYPWEVLEEMKKHHTVILPKITVNNINDAEVYAHSNVEIQPYCLFSGLVILDEGVKIGPYSFLRGPIYIGRNSLIGPYAEITRSLIMDNTSLAHKNIVGDSIFGNNINFGGMSVCCNTIFGDKLIKARYHKEIITYNYKYGAMIEDNSNLGYLTALMPGCYIPKNTNIIGQCIVHGNANIKFFIDPTSLMKVINYNDEIL